MGILKISYCKHVKGIISFLKYTIFVMLVTREFSMAFTVDPRFL